MKRLLLAFALFLSAACNGDESVARYGAAGKIWTLAEMDGAAFSAHTTIEFGENGQVSGDAPCNRYSTEQSAPYPWFNLGPILSTKMACSDSPSETAFFSALAKMTLSDVPDETLILSNDAGETLVFKTE